MNNFKLILVTRHKGKIKKEKALKNLIEVMRLNFDKTKQIFFYQ